MNKKPLKKLQIYDLLKKISYKKLSSEKVKLKESHGRILSKNIVSKIKLPPFNNSAVDGYAIHKSNIENRTNLICQYRISAGDNKVVFLKKNEVARIFTGAPMPKNSKTVVMQENVILYKNNQIKILKNPKEGENCRIAGEDVSNQKPILFSGQMINSQNLNLIAAIGMSEIIVRKKIKVGYFTSGNELKEPSEILQKSEINNSNRYLLLSLLNKNFLQSKYLGILKDNEESIVQSLNKNIKNFNVIITTGGASVGEEDHLIDVIRKIGKIFFWKTAIKPGRPMAIGKINQTIIICLPGNPVSVHLLYQMIIYPFLKSLCGSKLTYPKCIKAKVNFTMKKKSQRLEWLRVKIIKDKKNDILVSKYAKQGSGMISSIAFSDGIIEIPENINLIRIGDQFDLYLFDHFFN